MFRFATATLASCQSMPHVYDVLHCVQFVHVCLRGSGSLRHCFRAASQTKNIARMLQCTIHIGSGAEPGSLAPAAPLYHTRTMHVLIFDLRACSLCSSAPSPNSMLKSERRNFDRPCESERISIEMGAVSYTHLTLPTICSV